MRALRSAVVVRKVVVIIGAVVAVAACGNGGGDELPAVEGPTSPRLEVRATEMVFEPAEIAVEAGEVEVVFHNDGTVLHDLRIDEQPFILEAGAGEMVTGSVVLDEGRYQFFCSLPGHREAGMEGVVEMW